MGLRDRPALANRRSPIGAWCFPGFERTRVVPTKIDTLVAAQEDQSPPRRGAPESSRATSRGVRARAAGRPVRWPRAAQGARHDGAGREAPSVQGLTRRCASAWSDESARDICEICRERHFSRGQASREATRKLLRHQHARQHLDRADRPWLIAPAGTIIAAALYFAFNGPEHTALGGPFGFTPRAQSAGRAWPRSPSGARWAMPVRRTGGRARCSSSWRPARRGCSLR